MEQYDMEQPALEQSKKIISRSFFALFILAVVVFGVQNAVHFLVIRFKPEIADTDWYGWALTALSIVVIGFPIYYLIIRSVPDSPKGNINRIKPSVFIVYFFICTAAMYITNFATQIITVLISIIKGKELVNPASEALLNENYLISIIYAAIIAPFIEEMIFRKLLLNKLRRFGDIPAILMTGLAFGLFHFNLQQFFYAAVLGFIFAYITIQANTVIYSVILHMMINLTSTLFTPVYKDMNMAGMMMILLWMLISITLGVVFFILNIRKIKFEKVMPTLKTSAYLLNPGTILFAVISAVYFTLSVIG